MSSGHTTFRLLDENPGQYPFRLENLFTGECKKCARLIFEKYDAQQGATMLIGTDKAYKELKNDLN